MAAQEVGLYSNLERHLPWVCVSELRWPSSRGRPRSGHVCDGREENRATEAACLWELLFLSLPREGCSGFVVQKEHSFFERSCRSSQQG